jgi:hypothetical protein
MIDVQIGDSRELVVGQYDPVFEEISIEYKELE